jgi:hypothetical protein
MSFRRPRIDLEPDTLTDYDAQVIIERLDA